MRTNQPCKTYLIFGQVPKSSDQRIAHIFRVISDLFFMLVLEEVKGKCTAERVRQYERTQTNM